MPDKSWPDGKRPVVEARKNWIAVTDTEELAREVCKAFNKTRRRLPFKDIPFARFAEYERFDPLTEREPDGADAWDICVLHGELGCDDCGTWQDKAAAGWEECPTCGDLVDPEIMEGPHCINQEHDARRMER